MSIFAQNIIAVIWDFDETMTPQPMQRVLFDAYQQDSENFWNEVKRLPNEYRRQGCALVSETLMYLNHIVDYVQGGRFKGLSNNKLRELGGAIEFYPGLLWLLKHLKEILRQPKYSKYDLSLEHYVLSTGLRKLIEGSKVASLLTDIWGCEFIEGDDGQIARVAYVLDDTTKTRAIFEINKGVNKDPHIQVNDYIAAHERRVPMEQMIYIADGPSDVPVFSLIKHHRGKTLGVYDPNSKKKYEDACRLEEDNRIDSRVKADYNRDEDAALWLERTVCKIADSIVKKREQKREASVSPAPKH